MDNGWSNNRRMISQSLAKHKNDFDPTRHCEIKSAQPSPRGTHSPLGRKSIISRRNLHLPIQKTEGRDQAVRKASQVHSSLHLWLRALEGSLCCSGSVCMSNLARRNSTLLKQIPPGCCHLPDGSLSLFDLSQKV